MGHSRPKCRHCQEVTLHMVGVGPRAFNREPLRSFLHAVQSDSGALLHRRAHCEHKDWAGFIEWLDGLPLAKARAHFTNACSCDSFVQPLPDLWIVRPMRNLEKEAAKQNDYVRLHVAHDMTTRQ
eukprot:5701801-Amphidinium_carterae.1